VDRWLKMVDNGSKWLIMVDSGYEKLGLEI
jgi:hypothetical protein